MLDLTKKNMVKYNKTSKNYRYMKLQTLSNSIMGCNVSVRQKLTGRNNVPDLYASIDNNAMSGLGVGQLRLESVDMVFTKDQLASLNRHFNDQIGPMPEEISRGQIGQDVADIVERLVQRLVCGVGVLDSRFASKFLVRLATCARLDSDSCPIFEYLIRLDALSSPPIHDNQEEFLCRLSQEEVGQGVPHGFARVSLLGENGEAEWAEFIAPGGFLRRDKIQERFVELLALSAGGASPRQPSDVNEFFFCGIPGKVLEADILDQVLKLPPEEQIFFGSVGSDHLRYPDPRDFRLAIVEEPAGVRLRVGFLSPTLNKGGDVEVHLVLAIGFDGWPEGSDFPGRIELFHSDALMYYQAAKTGMYAVAVAPSPLLKCENRSSIWKISLPASASIIRSHYGPASVSNKIICVLNNIVQKLYRFHGQENVKLVNTNVLLTLLWLELEKCVFNTSSIQLIWTPEMLSYHVLKIIDRLLIALKNKFQRSYFFSLQNIFLSASDFCDMDFKSDTEKIRSYLEHIYEESRHVQRFDNDKIVMDRVQTILVHKWVNVIADLSPPTINRSRRLSFTEDDGCYTTAASTQFTKRQLEYFKMLFKEILEHREISTGNPFIFLDNGQLIFLINFIFDRALRIHQKTDTLKSKKTKKDTHLNATKVKIRFENAKQCVFEAIRKEIRSTKIDFRNESLLVGHVFKWLYRVLDEDKRLLAPILRPYLHKLFVSSYENSWHLDSWKVRESTDEISTLRTFCKLINTRCVKPLVGVVDAANKGWYWGQDMLEMVQKYGHINIVLLPVYGTCEWHSLEMASSSGLFTLRAAFMRNAEGTLRNTQNKWMAVSTLPTKWASLCENSEGTVRPEEIRRLSHLEIRKTTPMTRTYMVRRRYGVHRGLGDLMEALVNLNKFSILQEISTLLPDAERLQMLDTIHRISKGNRRRHIRTIRSRSQSNQREPDHGYVDEQKHRTTASRTKKKHAIATIRDNNNRQRRNEPIVQTYRLTDESMFLYRRDAGDVSSNDVSEAQRILDIREKQLCVEIERTKRTHSTASLRTSNGGYRTSVVSNIEPTKYNNNNNNNTELFKKVFEISPIMLRGQKCPVRCQDDNINDTMIDGDYPRVDYRKTFQDAIRGKNVTKL